MSKGIGRIRKIEMSLRDIEFILHGVDLKVTKAIEDAVLKPAIRMHITRIAEQFDKLKKENEFELLEHFSKDDLRGLSAVRNFIAHDYDSVDDLIIENALKYNFPKIKEIVLQLLEDK
jgi:uncharacterized protein with HEPN domain